MNTTVLAINKIETPFPGEVLRFLLDHEKEITNKVLRDFIRGYGRWLYDCAGKETEVLPGGLIALERWETEDGGSYGYNPSDVAFYLIKLNQFIYGAMSYAYLRNTGQSKQEKLLVQELYLSEETLIGLSCCLGFYVLARYCTAEKNTSKEWFNKLCHLSAEITEIETWRPSDSITDKRNLAQQLLRTQPAPNEPYYNTRAKEAPAKTKPQSPPQNLYVQVQKKDWYNSDYVNEAHNKGIQYGFNLGYETGYKQHEADLDRWMAHYNVVVMEQERMRLVAFVKALRQVLNILLDDPVAIFAEEAWKAMTNETSQASVNRTKHKGQVDMEEIECLTQPTPQPSTGKDNHAASTEDFRQLFEKTKDVFQ